VEDELVPEPGEPILDDPNDYNGTNAPTPRNPLEPTEAANLSPAPRGFGPGASLVAVALAVVAAAF
jgi:hypothetical protein